MSLSSSQRGRVITSGEPKTTTAWCGSTKTEFERSSSTSSWTSASGQPSVNSVNRLRLTIKATGLADTRTLIIPVAHTIFWEAGPTARAAMGMGDSMIRLSVGLEDVEDLLADFDQALEGS